MPASRPQRAPDRVRPRHDAAPRLLAAGRRRHAAGRHVQGKAGFGAAAGSLGVPLLALVVFRGRGDPANLRIIPPGAMLGIALGWLIFGQVDARRIRLLIGIEAPAIAVDRFRAARNVAGAVPSAPTLDLPGTPLPRRTDERLTQRPESGGQ